MSRGVAVLGSTGSVGQSALRVVKCHPDRLRVVALAAGGSQPDSLLAQVREHRPALVAVHDPRAARALAKRLPPDVELVVGDEGLAAAATHPDVERVVGAVVGAAGLPAVHAAVAAGIDVALANKESLVVAGRLLMELAAESGAAVLPVDSEHAALHQALRCGAQGEIARLVLTASGGPFWPQPDRDLETVTPAEALAHPTWRMGDKITIDSATLMNKGLELIEACHLFGVGPGQVEVVVHPQSLVHSLVEFVDGSWVAQLSANDMALPAQYALSYPERWSSPAPRLAPAELGRLEFAPLDPARFPAVELARAALAAGDSGSAVLNGANEEAVAAFLEGRIPLPAIWRVVARALAEHGAGQGVGTLEEALAWHEEGRRRARELLAAGLAV